MASVDLSPAAKRVYMAIKSKPMQSHKRADLVEALGLTVDVVKHAITDLLAADLIEKATFDKAAYVFKIKTRPISPATKAMLQKRILGDHCNHDDFNQNDFYEDPDKTEPTTLELIAQLPKNCKKGSKATNQARHEKLKKWVEDN